MLGLIVYLLDKSYYPRIPVYFFTLLLHFCLSCFIECQIKNSNSWFPFLAPYLISKAFKLSLFCVQLACLSTTSLVKLRKNSFSYNLLRILWHELMLILLNISAFIMPSLIKFFILHVMYRLFCNISSVSTIWHF